jgi:hypothetical protein
VKEITNEGAVEVEGQTLSKQIQVGVTQIAVMQSKADEVGGTCGHRICQKRPPRITEMGSLVISRPGGEDVQVRRQQQG